MTSHPVRIAAAGAVALAALAGAAVPANADSIVYEKGGNIWIAAPNGSRQVRITSGGGYERPSQANDGTIVALRKVRTAGRPVPPRQLVRLDRRGRLRSRPFFPFDPAATFFSGPFDARVSPDGRRVALMYSYVGPSLTPGFHVTVTDATRRTPKEKYGDLAGYINPFWVNSGTLGLFEPDRAADVQTDPLAGSALSDWIQDSDVDLGGGELDASGTRFAGAGTRADGGKAILRLYSQPARPPAAPQARCDIEGARSYFRPTWSPTGRALAWQEADGIHVGRYSLATCRGSEKLVIRGGHAPDWAAAAHR